MSNCIFPPIAFRLYEVTYRHPMTGWKGDKAQVLANTADEAIKIARERCKHFQHKEFVILEVRNLLLFNPINMDCLKEKK